MAVDTKLEPQAFTEEEVRELFVDRCRETAHYWAAEERGGTVKDRCEGVAFSILAMIDGVADFPAIDMICAGDDEETIQEKTARGKKHFAEGTWITDPSVELHGIFY